MMTSTVWCVLLCLSLPPMCLSAPAAWRKLDGRQSQACGDRLADMMQLVCYGRGYNIAFGPERRSTRRFRRGIVDECCRNSCTPAMLELYCRPVPTETPTSVQIRKRSDTEEESIEHKKEKAADQRSDSISGANELTTVPKERIPENKVITPTTTRKESDNSYKRFNLLTTLPRKHDINTDSLNKITPNDTTEEEFNQLDNIPQMRHKNHHHRQLRRKKISMKTKRDKGTTGETFKIGTIKPYFAARPLALSS